MSTDQRKQFPLSVLGLAIVAGVILIGSSFIVAVFTQYIESLFSRSPTVPIGTVILPLDVISGEKKYIFHVTVFTIWATMLLCLPAFGTVWFVRRNRTAASYWLAFWTVGLFAMLVHQYLAMGVLFEWNWQHILKDTVRVTIPIPDLILTVWWIIDVILGWYLLYSKNIVIHTQRIILHSALLIIFLIGFIREGEIMLSKIIGLSSALALVVFILLGLKFFSANTKESY